MANLDQQSIDENRAPAGGEEELDLEYPQYYKEGAQPIETLPKGKQLTSEDYKELALRLSPEQWRQAFREKNISEADANKFVEQMQELRLKELKTAEDVKGFKKFLKTLSNLPGNKWLRGALAAIMLMVTPIPDVEATQRDEQSSSEQAPAQNLEEAEGHEFTVKYPKGIKVSKEEGIGEAEPEEAVEVDPLAGKDLKIKPRVKLNKTTVKIDQESMRTGNDPSTETLPNPETLFSKGDQFDLKVDWSKRYEAKKISPEQKEALKEYFRTELRTQAEEQGKSVEEIKAVYVKLTGKGSSEGNLDKNRELQHGRGDLGEATVREVLDELGIKDFEIMRGDEDKVGADVDGEWLEKDGVDELLKKEFGLNDEQLHTFIRNYNRGHLNLEKLTEEERNLLNQVFESRRGVDVALVVAFEADDIVREIPPEPPLEEKEVDIVVPEIEFDLEQEPEPEPVPVPRPTPKPVHDRYKFELETGEIGIKLPSVPKDETPEEETFVTHRKDKAIIIDEHGVVDPQNYGEFPPKGKKEDFPPPPDKDKEEEEDDDDDDSIIVPPDPPPPPPPEFIKSTKSGTLTEQRQSMGRETLKKGRKTKGKFEKVGKSRTKSYHRAPADQEVDQRPDESPKFRPKIEKGRSKKVKNRTKNRATERKFVRGQKGEDLE